MRPLRCGGYREKSSPRTHGPHRACGTRGTHMVLPLTSQQDWLPARPALKETRRGNLLRTLCSNQSRSRRRPAASRPSGRGRLS